MREARPNLGLDRPCRLLKIHDVTRENYLDDGNPLADALAEVTVTARHLTEKTEAHASAVFKADREGASLRQIASAAGYSTSRVYNLLRRGTPQEADSEGAIMPASPAQDVVVMTAPRWWPLVYKLHAAIVCKAHRSIRPRTRYAAMLMGNVILPDVPMILHVNPAVRLGGASFAELRSSADPYSTQVADIGEAVLAEHVADPDTTVQIMVCTPANDPRTITLPQPIEHNLPGPWATHQRYVSSDALLAGVTTTAELNEVKHTMTTELTAPARSLRDSGLRIVAFKLSLKPWELKGGDELYERTRFAWRTQPLRHDPDYAFATANGIVRAVYRIDDWEQIPPDRWAFHGELDSDLTAQWAGADVTGDMGPGANPVRYFNC